MKLSLVFTALLSSVSVLATPIEPRSAATIVAAINQIASGINTLQTATSSFQGGLFEALAIQNDASSLANDLQNAIDVSNSSPKLSDAGSATVATKFLNLEPKIFKLLNTIVAKKPQFDTAIFGFFSVSFLVLSDLKQQRDLAAQLGPAVAAKLTAPYAAAAPQIEKMIANHFASAIAAYSQ